MATLTKCQSHARLVVGFSDNTSRLTPSIITTENGGGDMFTWTIAGNSANSVNELYAPAVNTISANTGITIDISNSTASRTPLNTAATLARTKIVYISVAAQTGLVNGVLLNGSFANSHLSTVHTIKPGGTLMLTDPSANGTVVDSTHKNIRLENLDVTNTANVSITVVGGAT